MSDRGAALRAFYGMPESCGHEGNVWKWRHASEEGARAFAAANGEDGSAFCEDDVWYTTVDLTRRIAIADAEYRASLTAGVMSPAEIRNRMS